MARKGREFEKLVTMIEKNLCPVGAIVKSPDRILDKATGNFREVDASIRYQIGSAPILITVECRDRSSVQDITWLEQVKAKKDSIVANQTIVVSNEGFTAGAKNYAKQHGILLRQISEITDDFWLRSLQGLKVMSRDIRCHLTSYNIGYFRKPEDTELEQLSLKEEVHKAIRYNKPFAVDKFGQTVTLKELYDEVLPILNDKIIQYIDEKAGGFNSEKSVEGEGSVDAEFEPNNLAVETVRGTRYIQTIVFGIRYEIRTESLPPLRSIDYIDENGKILDSFSTTSDQDSRNIRLKFDWQARRNKMD